MLSHHKKNKTVLQSGNTTPLQKSPKILSNKEYNPKTNKVTQDIEEYIQQANTHTNKDNIDGNGNLLPINQIILIPNRMSQFQVTTKMIIMKNQDINVENQ